MSEQGQRRVRSGRIARVAMLGGMAARLAGDAAAAAGRYAGDRAGKSAARRLHENAAKTLRKQLGDMKGLPMKLGQMLSYIDDFVPAEHRDVYRETLRELQVRARPMLWESIEQLIIDELGKPVDDAFATFNREPIAAASIGQVYRATTHDGREVAVKVQYPGIADAVNNDLRNADAVVRALSVALPRFDIEQTMADLTARLGEECDYTIEAKHQRAFRSAWQGDPEVYIPAVVDELSSSRLLTTEFVDGRAWQPMLERSTPEQRNVYGRAIFRFVFRSLYVHGVFNADPHPGNYLFGADGRVTFLDFGCVQHFDRETLEGIARVRMLAMSGVRGPAFHQELQRSYGLPESIDAELWQGIEDYMLLSFEPGISAQPYRYSRDYTERLAKATMHLKMEVAKRLFKVGFFETKRPGVVFLHRINFGLNSLLADLHAQEDWPAVIAAIDAEARMHHGGATFTPGVAR